MMESQIPQVYNDRESHLKKMLLLNAYYGYSFEQLKALTIDEINSLFIILEKMRSDYPDI